MCELYKDEMLVIKVGTNEYYGPIKTLYITFYDRIINVFYNGTWYPAKIIGKCSEKEMLKLYGTIGSKDLIVKCKDGDKSLSDIKRGDMILFNTIPAKYLPVLSESDNMIYAGDITETDITSDWLFGIEILDINNKYYTLMSGLIVSSHK